MKNIRNFSIISHVDHGKSTLADRLLEFTGTIKKEKMKEQFLDMMDLERERGITIKMQPVRMKYKEYVLNMIDTPGHVDFSYEVSRALAAVEGVLLLVDAIKGIQAQTLANLELAQKQNLVIVPIINKIDLPNARIEDVENEVAELLGINKEEILKISAKEGINIDQVLEAIINKIPAPLGNESDPFRALIFDSKYDSFKGVIAFCRVFEGVLKKSEGITFVAMEAKGETKDIGYFNPELISQNELKAGEIGYIATGVKEAGLINVGDTIIKEDNSASPLPGYKELKPVIFMSFYPENTNDFVQLKEALLKTRLTDPAFVFEPEFKEILGRGFRCGFLGSLHAEIISERLKREFGLNLVISSPSVVYRIIDNQDNEKLIMSVSDWPDPSQIKEIEEPWVRLEVMVPDNYLGGVMDILSKTSGKYLESKYFKSQKVLIFYEVPLRKMISGFHDKIKSITQGYASFSYEIMGFRKGDLTKLEILIGHKVEEIFSKIVSKDEAYQEGRKLVDKLKEILPSQQFSLAIQARVYGKIIARETIKARRKDVTGALYGGDYTRKRKLLEKQKKGKKRLKEIGKIKIPSSVFFQVFKD